MNDNIIQKRIDMFYMYTSFEDSPVEKIVTILKSNQSKFISGEKLSKSLNLSRAAIWKNIKKIQSLGYKIQSKTGMGYKLRAKTTLLLPWEISNGLQTDIFGRKIYYFNTIGSTQDFALRLTERPYENGSVIISATQTRGRGRLNRKWISPKGGIWLSILIKPNFEVSQTSIFPMVTSLALAKAIENILKKTPQIKWPNDIMLNNKKVAGILIDASVQSNKINYMIIGIGVNFRIDSKKILKSIKNSQRCSITTLVEKKDSADPIKLVQEFLLQLEQMYNNVISNNISKIRKEYINRSSTIGKSITLRTHNGIISGKAVSIDKNGALMISDGKKTKRLLTGDLTSR